MSATITAQERLAAALTRAGASDADRPLWLAQRAEGITATEVRKLYMRETTVAALIREKLAPPKAELRGRSIVWGRQRESIIAEAVCRTHGIVPESRVFHAKGNPRHLASPDGVGVLDDGRLATEEIKTGMRPITVGSPHYESYGYGVQQQWQIYVLDADVSVYVPEQHDNNWPEPAPLVPWYEPEIVERDEALIEKLINIAEAFLEQYDRAREGEALPFDEKLDSLAVDYLLKATALKAPTKAKEDAYAALRTAIEELPNVAAGDGAATFSQASPVAQITFTKGGSAAVTTTEQVDTYDEAAAKAARPELWADLELARAEAADAQRHLEEVEARIAGHLEQYKTASTAAFVGTKKVTPVLRVTGFTKPKGTKK
jgi:hypothetical protein